MKRLEDATATEAFGARLAQLLGAHGAIIALRGPLGAGKTTLVRGFLRACEHTGAVRSPTYTLLESYELGGRQILHLDLYRIAAGEGLDALGLRDALVPGAVVLVEWPERGAGQLPQADLELALDHLSGARSIAGTALSTEGARLQAALFPSD